MEEEAQENGIPNAEIIQYPADGKTAYQDKIMPLGWDATTGKLTILKGPGLTPGLVAADFQEHPFHLIKGSVGTAPEGEIVRILTYKQAMAQADASDALVMVPPDMGPMFHSALVLMLDLGARGMISDFAMNAADEPDGIQWCNAFTELQNWHATADDRPFIAFSITPDMGARLRKALDVGVVTAKIESDARRYETTVDLVTALVPGRRKEEFWILAHLYEPLSNDNSSGVAAAIETARLMMAEGQPEFSLRLQVRAGITGYAQIYSKYNTSPYDKLLLDLMYISKPNLADDIRIMFATLKTVFIKESTDGMDDTTLNTGDISDINAFFSKETELEKDD